MSKTTKLRNIHPCEVLREGFLLPLGISQCRLAKEICVTEARISAICSGKRAITIKGVVFEYFLRTVLLGYIKWPMEGSASQ